MNKMEDLNEVLMIIVKLPENSCCLVDNDSIDSK